MKTDIEKDWTVKELIDAREENELRVNPEYQRGEVWSESQMRLLIDSVLRNYQIPLIYLRKVEKVSKRAQSVYYDIIDGQQRINALRSFYSGTIFEERRTGDRASRHFKPLYDPSNEEEKSMFPYSLQEEECPWAGKTFNQLDGDTQKEFLNKKVFVAVMECGENEARDLFIRLQGGSALNFQEVRDTWPGNFCKIVLALGGKPKLGYPGHDFFLRAMNSNPGGDRGKSRKIAAQLLMLFLEQKDKGRDFFAHTKSAELDKYYRAQSGLDIESLDVNDFQGILDTLAKIFGDGNHPPLKAHDAIHLILFSDMLKNHYASGWESHLAGAFDKFSEEIGRAREFDEEPVGENKGLRDAWYYNWRTRTNADYPATIRQRHEIYVRRMLSFLGKNARKKDPQRGYTSLQREQIYYRDKKRCYFGKEVVAWADAEIHHLKPHSKGGATTLENGVLVCSDCHKKHHQNKMEHPNGNGDGQE